MKHERPQSPGEEIANAVSHAVGLAAILVAAPLLLFAASRGGAGAIVGASVRWRSRVALPLLHPLSRAASG
jgi:hemolysin III